MRGSSGLDCKSVFFFLKKLQYLRLPISVYHFQTHYFTGYIMFYCMVMNFSEMNPPSTCLWFLRVDIQKEYHWLKEHEHFFFKANRYKLISSLHVLYQFTCLSAMFDDAHIAVLKHLFLFDKNMSARYRENTLLGSP